MNLNPMKSALIWILTLAPLWGFSQEITELGRFPLDGVSKFRVGVILEEKKKPESTILGPFGSVYVEDDGSWKDYLHNILATDLRFIADRKGTLYLTGLNDKGELEIRESSDRGETWQLSGKLIPKREVAFYTVHSDRKTGDLHVLYATQEGEGESCKASVWLITSGNAGRKWSDPLLLNEKLASCERIMASMTSFRDGKRWAIWTDDNKFVVDRSYDGDRWLRTDISVLADYQGGMEFGVPNMIIDNSQSQMGGMIYLSGVTAGDSSTVAWVRKSGNVGDSWTGNVPLDPEYAGNQYYPALAVDHEVGALYATWLAESDGNLEAWFGYSLDAGQTFKRTKLSEWSKPALAMEAYSMPIDVAAYQGRILVTWLEVRDGDLVQKAAEFTQNDLFNLPGKKK